jgi:aspartyl/glutamyl-tRNA(Asn/Gln) amidotransferase C subunit
MLSELDFAADSCADFLSAADNHLRPDEAQPSMPVEEIMKNAPKRQGDFFSVPKAIE